jgi:biotin-dependent carboxylase-like uncharacterized protein
VLEVLRAGPLTTVQDLGRPGYAHLGVPRSGALDQPALLAANALVGNPSDAAGLEITLLGCTLRARSSIVIAVTGAYADLRVNGVPAPFATALDLHADDEVHIGRTRHGVRSYLAVAGGIDVPPVLGSRSTDTLSGLGPNPLRDKDILPIGAPSTRDSSAESHREPPAGGDVVLRVRPGPRDDWFGEDAFGVLCGSAYTMTPLSNRVGARLAGAALTRAGAGELPSEGLVLGAVQVPADGQPLVFLADHPTTGGYPVIAVAHPADLSRLAQARPGASVSFHGSQR